MCIQGSNCKTILYTCYHKLACISTLDNSGKGHLIMPWPSFVTMRERERAHVYRCRPLVNEFYQHYSRYIQWLSLAKMTRSLVIRTIRVGMMHLLNLCGKTFKVSKLVSGSSGLAATWDPSCGISSFATSALDCLMPTWLGAVGARASWRPSKLLFLGFNKNK